MARDAETDRLKSAIPDMYRPPRNAGGLLTSYFSSSVDLLRKSTALQGSEIADRDRFNLGMGFLNKGDANPEATPSFILPGALAAARKLQIARHEEERHRDVRVALEQYRAALADRLAALNAELEALNREIDEIETRRTEIGASLEALDEIERLKRSGKLDPSNPAHAALLRTAGITPEEAKRDDLLDVIQRHRRDLDREDGTLETLWNAKVKRRDQVALERLDVIGAQQEIENADTDEARLLAERRAATVLGAQQLGEAALQTDSNRAKVIAADAVTDAEGSERRAVSANLNHNSVEANKRVVMASDTKEFAP